jgi:replication-associated recombination protein RarA
MMAMVSPNVIKHVEVDQLFGLHNYTLNFGAPQYARHESLLYGDNGTGKTTLLKLMYHLLSRKANEGSRTFLSRTDAVLVLNRDATGTTLYGRGPGYRRNRDGHVIGESL